MTHEDVRRTRWFAGAFIACVVLSTLSIGFVDRAVSTWSHATLGTPAPFVWLTHIIDPIVPASSLGLIGFGIAACFGWRPGPVGRALIAVCVAALIATIFKQELKFLFGRTWPETWTANNPSWIKNGVYRFEPLHGGKGWESFPSGHMTTITAPCTVLWMLVPRIWRWLWAALIAAVAIGLVGSDFHFVGDMIAGTFLGAACGIGAVAITRGLVRSPEAQAGSAREQGGRAEDRLELTPQHRVNLRHGHRQAEIDQ
jgi:membrane-associated phospholipid phosphatase